MSDQNLHLLTLAEENYDVVINFVLIKLSISVIETSSIILNNNTKLFGTALK